MKKKMAGLLALLFVTGTVLMGCSGSALDNAAEVMNVNGVSVPMGELNFLLRYQQTQMQSYYGGVFGEDFMNQDMMGLGTPYGETIRDSTADMLEEYYLVEANAEDLGVSLTEEEKSAAAAAAKAFLAANDSKALEAMSADEAVVTHVLELMALQSKAYSELASTIDREVDEEEIAQKRISYVKESTVNTSGGDGTVTEPTEEELEEKKSRLAALLESAKESKDLSAAAEEQGLTANSATYGKSDTLLEEAVKEAADKLSEGGFSDIIETESGYYVVYMESLFDEDATESARQRELSQREADAYSGWLDPLKEAAEITKNDTEIQKLTFERIFNIPEAEEAGTEETE